MYTVAYEFVASDNDVWDIAEYEAPTRELAMHIAEQIQETASRGEMIYITNHLTEETQYIRC